MRLTSFTDFGLRALMRMAAEPGRGFTTDEIARWSTMDEAEREHVMDTLLPAREGGSG